MRPGVSLQMSSMSMMGFVHELVSGRLATGPFLLSSNACVSRRSGLRTIADVTRLDKVRRARRPNPDHCREHPHRDAAQRARGTWPNIADADLRHTDTTVHATVVGFGSQNQPVNLPYQPQLQTAGTVRLTGHLASTATHPRVNLMNGTAAGREHPCR